VLPDPWSVHVRPNTSELNPYFDFVRSQVIDYTRTDGRIGVGTAYKFLAFMIRHGLRLSTVLAIMSQLIRERFAAVRWQRATILDRLQFDLFRYVYRKQKPQLSTFFINSTAHFQHCYWRNMDPSPFSLKPTPSDQNAHAGAVLHGYKAMDRIVGEVMAMAGDNATIVFATALGQQPCLTYEASGGKSFYKPNDFSTWLRAVGIEPSTCVVEPVMSEQFHLRFATPQAAADAAEILNQSTVNDQQAFGINVDGNSIMVGCCIFNELPPDSMLTTKAGAHRFADLLYFVDTVKSGMHHPEGLLWVRVPGEKPNQQSQTVPLVDVAPTILALLGLPAPKNTAGRSLLT
jgi:hypothetical protein